MTTIVNTPWGKAQTQETLAPGIIAVTTASHGGIHLSPTRNATVHQAWRDPKGWYEEDVDANIVVFTFPKVFSAARFREGSIERADRALRNWRPDEYEKVTGTTVTAAESFIRAEQVFAASVADKLVSTSAWGHGNDSHGRTRVPAGWVGVPACVGGRWRSHEQEKRYFLVPEQEYGAEKRPFGGFVIDPDRHPLWEPIPAEDPGQPVTVMASAVTVAGGKECDLYGAAKPHQGRKVGKLWRYEQPDGKPSRWLAYRAVGTPGGAPVSGNFATQEEALAAVGFHPAPFARIPQAAASESGNNKAKSS